MAHEREVLVKGDVGVIWDSLNSTLVNSGYKVKSSVPQKQIIAERGSRFVSSMVGGTKGGYRTAEVFLTPEGESIRVKFAFKFSALGAGTAYKGSKQEIDDMVQMFQSAIPAQSSIPTQHQESETPSALNCHNCSKDVNPDFSLCPYCGAKLGQSECSKCGKEINPDFKMCPYCGESIGE